MVLWGISYKDVTCRIYSEAVGSMESQGSWEILVYRVRDGTNHRGLHDPARRHSEYPAGLPDIEISSGIDCENPALGRYYRECTEGIYMIDAALIVTAEIESTGPINDDAAWRIDVILDRQRSAFGQPSARDGRHQGRAAP